MRFLGRSKAYGKSARQFMIKFNAILDKSPDEIFGGVVQRTDFKQVLKFFRLLADDSLDDEEKSAKVLTLFFTELPDVDDVWPYIESFIQGPDVPEGESEKRVFDYNVDHGRIYAAFLQTYNIDLRTASMHWWTFLELLQNLPEDTKLMQVIKLRGEKPDKNMTPEQRRALRKMQNRFRLDDNFNALEHFLNGL
ncbi:MAG TPA: Gp15 family bacteriophage protein [Spirochaetia bacterium]|nr:Gp15 family bacteriophage protein [Spirochaetia bacterium]